MNDLTMMNDLTRDRQNKRLLRFEREFKDVDLARYFQLKYNSREKIEIEKTIQKSGIDLTIRYTNRIPCPSFDLPDELKYLIGEYLFYTIEIQTKINYSQTYPFTPPIWFMRHVNHNIKREYNPFYLLEYYIDKINHHNHIYNLRVLDDMQWHPVISIEGDILLFLQKINHFDQMITC